jgi:uncharacterized repeat protein (TIGR01451 family)
MACVSAKSMYLVADHHTAQFDAWNINPDGTVTYQATYNLTHANDPAGVAIDSIPKLKSAIFITAEFDTGFEIIDGITFSSIGVAPGPKNLAGIDIDDQNDIIYVILREDCNLYVFDWDLPNKTATLRTGFPISLPNCMGAYGIALDEKRNILWIADAYSNKARAYNVTTWDEDNSKSFTPSHVPIDIAVDRLRGYVYTVSASEGFGGPGGSYKISKYNLATKTESFGGDLGCQGVGIAVDEDTGYVYVTVNPYCGSPGSIQVWDTSAWTKVDEKTVSGSPAGIAVGGGYGYPDVQKDDGIEIVMPGESLTYSICYDNINATQSVSNVIVLDQLPAELEFVGVTGGGIYDPVNHTVTWDLGTLEIGDFGCFNLDTKAKDDVQPCTIITNYVTIDSNETIPKTDSDTNQVYCPQCSDQIDNDEDELVDYPEDPGCSDSWDDDETDVEKVPLLSPVGIVVLTSILGVSTVLVIRRR